VEKRYALRLQDASEMSIRSDMILRVGIFDGTHVPEFTMVLPPLKSEVTDILPQRGNEIRSHFITPPFRVDERKKCPGL